MLAVHTRACNDNCILIILGWCKGPWTLNGQAAVTCELWFFWAQLQVPIWERNHAATYYFHLLPTGICDQLKQVRSVDLQVSCWTSIHAVQRCSMSTGKTRHAIFLFFFMHCKTARPCKTAVYDKLCMVIYCMCIAYVLHVHCVCIAHVRIPQLPPKGRDGP